MNRTTKILLSLLAAAALLLCVSCTGQTDASVLWEKATYLADTTLGEGVNTVRVELTAGDKTVTLTLNTDKATLGEALFEHSLINDPSFFDTCNGIKADWDKDQAYWSFYVDGRLASYGVNDPMAVTADAPAYRLVYTK